MKLRLSIFVILFGSFTLLHALLTLYLILFAFNATSPGPAKVLAAIFALPILLPLMQYDPDGEMLPGWFRFLSFQLNSLVWAVALSMIILLIHRAKRRRERDAGLCPSCGYDLRATPDRCPECGHVIRSERAASTP